MVSHDAIAVVICHLLLLMMLMHRLKVPHMTIWLMPGAIRGRLCGTGNHMIGVC